jgi:hypothetical protein
LNDIRGEKGLIFGLAENQPLLTIYDIQTSVIANIVKQSFYVNLTLIIPGKCLSALP